MTQNEAITALREALAEQAEQEPVAWIDPDDLEDLIESGEGACVSSCQSEIFSVPLYTAPLRTKDLTASEIRDIWNSSDTYDVFCVEFARAVIAADREKNNANNNT